MKKYAVEDRETGVRIENFDTLEEAEKCMEEFEEMDKKDGIYEKNFYSIVEYEESE